MEREAERQVKGEGERERAEKWLEALRARMRGGRKRSKGERK